MAFTDNTTGGRIIEAMTLPYKLTITDTCLAGDLIGFDSVSSEVWERAKSNSKIYASFIAGEDCTSTAGVEISVYREACITGFSGGEAGKLVYLSTSAGQYVGAPEGDYHQCVGIMTTGTSAIIRPDCVPVMAYSSEANSTGLVEAGFFRAELMDGTGASMFGGVKIETKVNTAADTLVSMRSLYIYHQILATGGANDEDNQIVRLEDGSTIHPQSFIEFAQTSTGPTYIFSFISGTGSALGTGSTCSTGAGWLRVQIGGSSRYINLYSDTPA